MTQPDYIEVNRQSWNKKTEIHVESAFYNNEGFINGKSSLNEIELDLLGDISGKSVLHLQCHFGQDTISLSRMGAKATGADLSDKAIEKANELSQQTGAGAKFVCCDIYDLPQHLNEKFDLVFTTYGTIGWLPDLDKWAAVISHFLKPGGRFIFVEFHPVVWMFDDNFTYVKYNYFNTGPIAEIEEGTYADKNSPISQSYVCWNHGLGEVVTALLSAGLSIDTLDEFDYSPYNCFNETVEVSPKKFRIKHLNDKIPMVYSISASKRS